jgi:integrase
MGKYRVTREDIVRPHELKVYLLMAKDTKVRCLLALLGAFGKRISETLQIRFRDIRIDPTHISIQFRLGKRQPQGGILRPSPWKKLSRNHYLAGYIEAYLDSLEGLGEGFIFPSYGESGHLTDRWARYKLDQLSEDIWPHLFRTSLATLMGEARATAFEIKEFFDWKDLRTAQKYVIPDPTISDKWASRDF